MENDEDMDRWREVDCEAVYMMTLGVEILPTPVLM